MENSNLKCFRIAFSLCVLCMITLYLVGCMSAPGQTSDEVQIKQMRTLKSNTKQLQDDIDTLYLLDRPSRLSDKAIR